MTFQELDRQIGELAIAFDRAPASKRQAMRPQINRIIRNLNSQGLLVPRRLSQIEERLDDEVEEDFFDNMPV